LIARTEPGSRYDARSMTRWLLAFSFLFSLTAAAQTYVREGFAVEDGAGVTLRDADCSSTQPPALFGCGVGADGLPFAARGGLGRGITFDAALGREVGRWRVELALASRFGTRLEASSNFTGVVGEQPVTARVRSQSLLLAGGLDLGAAAWRVRPFVTAGAGVAQNESSDITFTFPGIGPSARTTTSGGTMTGFAWTAGAGVTIRIKDGLSVDVTARYTDLGDVGGDRGEATIVRPSRSLLLDVDATKMRWRARGVAISIRQSF
jgi:opacity protein-like surface antigen